MQTNQCLQSVILNDLEEWLQGRDFGIYPVSMRNSRRQGTQVILYTKSAFPVVPILVRVIRNAVSRTGTILFREVWDDFSVGGLFAKIDPSHGCEEDMECVVQQEDRVWRWNQEFVPNPGFYMRPSFLSLAFRMTLVQRAHVPRLARRRHLVMQKRMYKEAVSMRCMTYGMPVVLTVK